MTDRIKILQYFKDFFKLKGFKKKGNIFWKENDYKNLMFCEFQPSYFSNIFYLNFGVYYKNKNENISDIKSHIWHFESSFNRIIKEIDPTALNYDIEDGLLNEIFDKIQSRILPELENIASFSYMKDNFPYNFDDDTWWLKNLTVKELIIKINGALSQMKD